MASPSLHAHRNGAATIRRPFAVATALGLAGTVLVVPQASAQEVGTLNWGIRDSFNGYISSPIAGGTIDPADGAEWDGSAYAFPVSSVTGDTVNTAGKVHWSGHGGVLDITVSDVQLHDEGDGTGYITVDYSGTSLESEEVESADDLRFVDVTFAADPDFNAGGTVTGSTTLTEAGTAVFGNYAAGSEFNDFSLSLAGEGQESPAPRPEPTLTPSPTPSPTPTTEPTPDSEQSSFPDLSSTDEDSLAQQLVNVIASVVGIAGLAAVGSVLGDYVLGLLD